MSASFVSGPTAHSPRRGAILLVLALLWLAHGAPCRSASPKAVRGESGMVVTPDARATEVGLEVLQAGGNAVDAAVAVALILAVTYPPAGNLGGGGLMLYRDREGEHFALDFRETSPKALRADLFLNEEGKPVAERSLDGGLAIGVPGTVAGLADAHRRWGNLPWARLVAPATRTARRGFAVSAWLAETLKRSEALLRSDAGSRDLFTRRGELLGQGELLVQSDLAASLASLAERGPDVFYRGPIAAAIVDTVREHGGVMEREDLARYRPVLREPLEGRYRGFRVVTFPPPSSGGIALLQILGTLERFDLRASGAGSSRTVHWMAEAERRAFADRSRWLGDPAFFDVPVDALLDAEYLARRAADIDPDRVTPSRALSPGEPRRQDSGETTHCSIADRGGAGVSMTLTLNRWYGSGIVARGTGILLNNEIDDFALAPDTPNLYGLVGGAANAVEGGKRPLSSMSPTIVELPVADGRPLLILGSPGGPTIITTVLQVIVNVIDHQMPLQEAVNAPRFHHQWLPDEIRHEIRVWPTDVALALVERGHRLSATERSIGNVNAIGLDERGHWLGAPDPRRQGVAAGF